MNEEDLNKMNMSQRILRELSKDPKESLDFMKRLNKILAMQERSRFLIITSFLLGILLTTLLFYIVR